MLGEDRRHRGAIADVGANEDVLRVVDDRCQVIEISGVGELVDGDDPHTFGDKCAYQSRPDKAGAAGHDDGHQPYSKRST